MMLMSDKRERIVALDLLRGFFLIVIIIDHFGMFPSPYEFLTGRGVLWASAAEGFFLISGLLVGYVYTPRLARSFKAAAIKIWKRAGLLYFLSIILTLLFTVWGLAIAPSSGASGLWQDGSVTSLLYQTITLQYTYGWADFLRYYAVFMLVAPLVLWLCIKRLAWVALTASTVLWLATQQSLMLSWHILFTIGIVVGFYLPQIQAWFSGLSPRYRSRIFISVVGVAVVTVIISALVNRAAVYLSGDMATFSSLPAWLQSAVMTLNEIRLSLVPWTDKDRLGGLRFAAALVWFTALYLLFRRFETVIDKTTKGVLRTYGENSLMVYVVQAFMVFIVLAYVGQRHSIFISTVLTTLGLALAFAAARYRKIFSRRINL